MPVLCLQRGFIAIMLFMLAACAPPPKVVVEERAVLTVRQETEKLGGQLVRFVQPGDTLYSIAFINNLDVNKIAAWNNIKDSREIKVGQKIRLTEPIGFQYPTVEASSTTQAAARPAVAKRTSEPAQASKPSVQPRSVDRTGDQTKTGKGAARETKSSLGRVGWRWPTRGKVIANFALAKGRQGIDISAQQGQPVMAADRGEVVYVGNSLKGYGNLVIIKHDETYLSAYAHNKDIYVREGQIVAPLQTIGSVGANNLRQNALHFQIRKHGKPVDPMRYLPKI